MINSYSPIMTRVSASQGDKASPSRKDITKFWSGVNFDWFVKRNEIQNKIETNFVSKILKLEDKISQFFEIDWNFSKFPNSLKLIEIFQNFTILWNWSKFFENFEEFQNFGLQFQNILFRKMWPKRNWSFRSISQHPGQYTFSQLCKTFLLLRCCWGCIFFRPMMQDYFGQHWSISSHRLSRCTLRLADIHDKMSPYPPRVKNPKETYLEISQLSDEKLFTGRYFELALDVVKSVCKQIAYEGEPLLI